MRTYALRLVARSGAGRPVCWATLPFAINLAISGVTNDEKDIHSKGRLPNKHDKPLIRAKWQFLGRLFTAVKKANGC